MKNIRIILLSITLAILSWSCECVVESDPKAIITPTEFANVLFINAMPSKDMKELLVFSSSKYVKRIDTISNNWTNLVKEYKKVGIMVAGVKNSIKIVNTADTNTNLFNSVVNLKKDSNYTFVAYGKDKNIQTIIKSDYLRNYNQDNIYLRCYNASADSPELTISFTMEGFSKVFVIKSGQASELSALPNGYFNVRVRSADSLFNALYPSISFSQGKLSNFVIKGSYKEVDIQYGIVTAEIPR